MTSETKLTDDDIAGYTLRKAKDKIRKRHRQNLCDDCGEPTENSGYCDNCELRHLQFR